MLGIQQRLWLETGHCNPTLVGHNGTVYHASRIQLWHCMYNIRSTLYLAGISHNAIFIVLVLECGLGLGFI